MKPSGHRWVRALLLVLSVGLVGGMTGCGNRATDDEQTELRLEPVSFAGEHPFTPPAGTDEDGVVPPDESGGTVPGDTAGMYGGSQAESSCDPDTLVETLAAHPDQTAAFAGVLEISTAEISTYIDSLTPVVLRSDILIVNHGFQHGEAVPIPAVFQAGTAVLVDESGAPVVKCYCGNPLTAPTEIEPGEFVGTEWATFSATAITIIEPASVAVSTFTLIEPDTGTAFDRPRATRGDEDEPTDLPAPSPAGPSPTPTEPAEATASWVVGGCYAEDDDLFGQVLVRNHDDETHSYEVTVEFGPDGSFGEAVDWVTDVSPDQTARRRFTTAAVTETDDGPVPCRITQLLDETGARPVPGPPLPPPPDAPRPTSTPTPSPTTPSPTPVEPEPTEPDTPTPPAPSPPTGTPAEPTG